MDNEAGMEHLSRRTTNNVDCAGRRAESDAALAPGGAADPGAFPRVAGADRAGARCWSTASARRDCRRRSTGELAGLEAERLPDVPQDDEVERAGAAGQRRLPLARRQSGVGGRQERRAEIAVRRYGDDTPVE